MCFGAAPRCAFEGVQTYSLQLFDANRCSSNLCLRIPAQVVRLDRSLLLVHQLCELQELRRHQTDDEQLHVRMHTYMMSCNLAL